MTLPGGRPPQGPELSSPLSSPARASSVAPQPRRLLAPEGYAAGTVSEQTRGSGCRCPHRALRAHRQRGATAYCALECLGTPGSYGRSLSQSPTGASLAAGPRPHPNSLAQRGQETYPRSHSKQASDRQGQSSALTLRGPLRTPRVPQPQPRLRRNARARAGPGARDADRGASSPGASQNPLSSHAPRLPRRPRPLPPPWGALRGHGTRCLLCAGSGRQRSERGQAK